MIILENTETGEIKEVGNSGQLRPPWKVKGFIQDNTPAYEKASRAKAERDAKLAVWATKFGLPVAQFLDTARWLLDKDCPFCQLGTQVLRRLDELGAEKATELLTRVLEAKQNNNLELLNQLKSKLESRNIP